MKQFYYRKSMISLVFLSAAFMFGQQPVVNYYSIRSQGFDNARRIAGITNQISLPDQEKPYGSLWTTIDYGKSFRPNAISRCLFGDARTCCDSCSYITISGSDVSERGTYDLLADYFGLPTDFKSTVFVKPELENFIFDCNFYLGLDEWANGLYFAMQAPIVHTRWDMHAGERIIQHGSKNHPAGYFSADNVPNAHLLDHFLDFAACQKAPTITDSSLTCSTITFQPLTQARFYNGNKNKTRVAELMFMVGWNFICDDTHNANYHAGFNVRTSAPSGTTPKARFLFEPMIGNGHHWEFGGGFNGHYYKYIGETPDQHLGFYGDITAVHLFKAHQKRTFDLKNRPLSRYMLAQKITSNASQSPRLNPDEFPEQAFLNEFTPVANLTTLDVDVSVGVQADILAMFNYTRGGFTYDLGYNLWAKTCENVTPACAYISELEKDRPYSWAIKGDAYVVGFENGTNDPVRLAATQSSASIHTGTNAPVATVVQPISTNPGIDARKTATSNNAANVNDSLGNQTDSSNPLKVLTINDIDLNEGRTKGISHKLFTHIGYAWNSTHHWKPYVGIGAEVEFGNPDHCKKCTSCSNDCCPCISCALSQWHVWGKGGISF